MRRRGLSSPVMSNDAVEPAATETYDELGGNPAPQGNDLSPAQAHAYGLDADEEPPAGPAASQDVPDPSTWASADDPMTPAQRDYLKALAEPAGETVPSTLTKAEASVEIDRLKGEGA